MNEHPFFRSRVTNLPSTALAKWGSAVLDEGFVPFPKRLLRCLAQILEGPNAIRDLQVILAVVDFARPNLSRHPSYEYLGFIAGGTEQDVKDSLIALRDAKLLEFVEDGDQVYVSLDLLRTKIVELTDDESREP